MCELLGVSADRKIKANKMLETFFGHSTEHRDGWGLALLDARPVLFTKEPVRAIDSAHLKDILKEDVETSKCIAHIRKATIGEVNLHNTHPFRRYDDSGRLWILAHNGTVFEAGVLSPYQYAQEGTTDSERILLYIIDEINKLYHTKGRVLTDDERIAVVEEAVLSIVPENKLDLIITDGDLMYVHKNEAGTLYKRETTHETVFATKPLTGDIWTEIPGNQLLVYRDGEPIYLGKKHDHTYVHDEERMKLIYFAYSGL